MTKNIPFHVIGNWKGHKTISEAREWFEEFVILWKNQPLNSQKVNIILFPASIHLTLLSSLIKDSQMPINLGIQNISPFSSGAYTGEISALMVKDTVTHTLIGHSERRTYFKETQEKLFNKFSLAHQVGIKSIYCIPNTDTKIPEKCKLVAYEPVWAIGTGKPCSAEKANQMAKQIKDKHGQGLTVIYGGSVVPDNIVSYFKTEHISGVLPGGASLDAQIFFQLLANVSQA